MTKEANCQIYYNILSNFLTSFTRTDVNVENLVGDNKKAMGNMAFSVAGDVSFEQKTSLTALSGSPDTVTSQLSNPYAPHGSLMLRFLVVRCTLKRSIKLKNS